MTLSSIALGPADRRRAAPWFIVEGGLLVVLGVVAVVLPGIAGVAASAVFGWILILAGVFGLGSLMGARHHAHLAWSIISAVVALGIGALIVWLPLVGAVTLAFFVAIYLLLDGFALLGLAWDQRKRGGRRWPWVLVSGAIDVLLGVLIAALGPLSDSVVLGFIIALDLIVAGIALAALGLAARNAV